MKKTLFFLTIVVLLLCSCGPYKKPKYVNIGTNETAFLIPLEEGTEMSQQKMRSLDYLNQRKVATKRVYLNQRKISTGRAGWSYKWVPTDTVVIVHRAPVTREWTKANAAGPNDHNQILNVESKESIGFDIPVNCTASVLEEEAAIFLYHFGGQTIEWVMDHNVRPFILDLLTTEFGKLTLDQSQNFRNTVYDTMKVRTIKFFKTYGLSIINLGVAGEYNYTDPEIQTAINTKLTSEMKIIAAQNEADAAKKFAEASEAIRKQKDLDADVNLKHALADAIRSGKLTWPNSLTLVGSSNKEMSILDIWGAKNLSSKQ